jgi:hypothetical protein
VSAWDVPDRYAEIDPVLEQWAERKLLPWQKEYKGWSVRSYSFALDDDESVQIWVDPPSKNAATVHVAFNSRADIRRKSQQATYAFEDLEMGLDCALRIAHDWKNGTF